MNFKFTVALWKGVKVAAVGALGVAVAHFFGAFDEASEWTKFGAPEWIGLVAVVGIEAARNAIKQWLKSLETLTE